MVREFGFPGGLAECFVRVARWDGPMATSASKTGARRKAASSKKSPKRRTPPVAPKAAVGRAKVRRKVAKKVLPKSEEYVPKTPQGRVIMALLEEAERRGDKLYSFEEISRIVAEIKG